MFVCIDVLITALSRAYPKFKTQYMQVLRDKLNDRDNALIYISIFSEAIILSCTRAFEILVMVYRIGL